MSQACNPCSLGGRDGKAANSTHPRQLHDLWTLCLKQKLGRVKMEGGSDTVHSPKSKLSLSCW